MSVNAVLSPVQAVSEGKEEGVVSLAEDQERHSTNAMVL